MNPDEYSPEQRALAKLAADFMDYTMILSHMEFARRALRRRGEDHAGRAARGLAEIRRAPRRFLPKMVAYIKAHPEAGAPMANPWLAKFYTRDPSGRADELQSRGAVSHFPAGRPGERSLGGPRHRSSPPRLRTRSWPTSELAALDRYGDIARAGADDAAFKSAAKAFARSTIKARGRAGEGQCVGLEVRYHKTEYFYQALLYFFGALLVVALSWLAPRGGWGRWCSRICVVLDARRRGLFGHRHRGALHHHAASADHHPL